MSPRYTLKTKATIEETTSRMVTWMSGIVRIFVLRLKLIRMT